MTEEAALSATQRIEGQIWLLVSEIPEGNVATYGQLAALAGVPQQSRLVGRILSRLPRDTALPWHRVINSRGEISNPRQTNQLARLRAEGVLAVGGRVRLRDYQWQP